MLKFLQEDEIYINAAKIIEIFVGHDCQTTSKKIYQIVKFPSWVKKFNLDLAGSKFQLWTNVKDEESSSRSGLYNLAKVIILILKDQVASRKRNLSIWSRCIQIFKLHLQDEGCNLRIWAFQRAINTGVNTVAF